MKAQELERQIERLRQPDSEEQEDALWILATSSDPQAISSVLKTLEELKDYDDVSLTEMMIDGLMLATPFTLPPVMNYLHESPLSKIGKDCAYMLGEIAYRQVANRDSRIVPALLKAVEVTLPYGTAQLCSSVAAVRECVRSGPVPEAEKLMWDILSVAAQEQGEVFYRLTVDATLEVLYAISGSQLLPKLHLKLKSLSPESNLASVIKEFLTEKE
jgi:hypothetical protein